MTGRQPLEALAKFTDEQLDETDVVVDIARHTPGRIATVQLGDYFGNRPDRIHLLAVEVKA